MILYLIGTGNYTQEIINLRLLGYTTYWADLTDCDNDLALVETICEDLTVHCIRCSAPVIDYVCSHCGAKYPTLEEAQNATREIHSPDEYIPKIQPKIVMVFADDTLTWTDEKKDCCYEGHDHFWYVNPTKSLGAKTEKEYADKKHIRCIRLSDLLQKGDINNCEAI